MSNALVRPNPNATPILDWERVWCRDPAAGALEVWSSFCLSEELDTSERLGLLVPKMKTIVLGFSTANRGGSRCRKCKDKENQIEI